VGDEFTAKRRIERLGDGAATEPGLNSSHPKRHLTLNRFNSERRSIMKRRRPWKDVAAESLSIIEFEKLFGDVTRIQEYVKVFKALISRKQSEGNDALGSPC
jgi:hypothetical protein